MKTKEELNTLKKEVENVSKKLAELTEEELVQVSGGFELSDAELDPEIDPAGFKEHAERMREQLGKEIFEDDNPGNYRLNTSRISPQKDELDTLKELLNL